MNTVFSWPLGTSAVHFSPTAFTDAYSSHITLQPEEYCVVCDIFVPSCSVNRVFITDQIHQKQQYEKYAFYGILDLSYQK